MPSRLQFRSRPRQLVTAPARMSAPRGMGALSFAAGGGGSLAGHPNAPGYATATEFDFGAVVPSGAPGLRQMGASELFVASDDGSLGDSGSNFSRVNDPTSPSGGFTWRGGVSAGQVGTSFPDCGGGGFGNFELPLPGVTKIYWAHQIRYADNFTFNHTSTKYVTLSAAPTDWGMLVEALNNGLWVSAVDNYNSRIYTPPTVPALNTVGAFDGTFFATCGPPGRRISTSGSWHRIEVRIEINTPYCQVWLDGVAQIANPTGQAIGGGGGGPSPLNLLLMTNHLGGGPTQVDALTYVAHDNLYVEYE